MSSRLERVGRTSRPVFRILSGADFFAGGSDSKETTKHNGCFEQDDRAKTLERDLQAQGSTVLMAPRYHCHTRIRCVTETRSDPIKRDVLKAQRSGTTVHNPNAVAHLAICDQIRAPLGGRAANDTLTTLVQVSHAAPFCFEFFSDKIFFASSVFWESVGISSYRCQLVPLRPWELNVRPESVGNSQRRK